ncbi:MAG: inositol monophosphatase [Acidobacteria bacterium]|nr:inositol monophosphatase [Acidobacteriota bacterium]
MFDDLVNAAVEAAHAGAEILSDSFRKEGREVCAKGEHDWVSAADRESEAAIAEELRRRFPDHQVLGEEGGLQGAGVSEFRWIVDPLDGTTNFLRGLPFYAVSIACQMQGRTVAGVVYDPERRELFHAQRGEGAFLDGAPITVSGQAGLDGACLATGFPFRARGALDAYLKTFHDIFLRAGSVRRCGSAALDLAYTAAGTFDGFWEFRLSPWDTAAGALLIEEAGGRVSNLDGGAEIFASGNVVAGNRAVHEELLETLRMTVSEDLLLARDPGGALPQSV